MPITATESYTHKIPSKIIPSQEAVELFADAHQQISGSTYSIIIFDITEYEYIHPIYAVLIASFFYLGRLHKKDVFFKT